MTFGEVFRELLKESKMTQAEFCRKSGLETGYISKINTDKIPDPSISKAYTIAKTFGLTLQELVDMIENVEYIKNDQELELLSAYRLLSDNNKSVVNTVTRALMLLEQ